MQRYPDVHRNADGSIDFDFYRQRAARQRRRFLAASLRRFVNLLVRFVAAAFARLRTGQAGRVQRLDNSIDRLQGDTAKPSMPVKLDELGGFIDYEERGRGPTIVLVPGSCSTGAAWRPVILQLGDEFRCVTTSLLGYGGTTERRGPFDTEIADEAEVLESVIRRAGGPVHLVGHSFGGLVSLAVALRNQVPLLSLTIAESPAAELLRNMGERQHYHAFRAMTGGYFAAYYGGEPAAIKSMIDFYGGPGTFASWPERVRDYAVRTTAVNILDWADVYGFDLTPERLAQIEIPTLVLLGANSHPAVQRANGLLARCIRGAAVNSIAGASHFMINTHVEAVARSIARHVARTEFSNRSAAA